MAALPILLGLVPGFAWLFFFMQEDEDGEPKYLIAFTFLAGIAFSFFALVVQIFLRSTFKGFGIGQTAILSLIIFALIEEIFKFAAAYYSVHRDPAFDVPVDAMIYMVVAAMGFATVENLAIAAGGALQNAAFFDSVFQTLSARFVGATLLHALTSGIVGYYWAVSILRLRQGRYLIWGFVLATGLHAFFNWLIITYGNVVFPILFVGTIGFFVLNDFEKLAQDRVNFRD